MFQLRPSFCVTAIWWGSVHFATKSGFVPHTHALLSCIFDTVDMPTTATSIAQSQPPPPTCCQCDLAHHSHKHCTVTAATAYRCTLVIRRFFPLESAEDTEAAYDNDSRARQDWPSFGLQSMMVHSGNMYSKNKIMFFQQQLWLLDWTSKYKASLRENSMFLVSNNCPVVFYAHGKRSESAGALVSSLVSCRFLLPTFLNEFHARIQPILWRMPKKRENKWFCLFYWNCSFLRSVLTVLFSFFAQGIHTSHAATSPLFFFTCRFCDCFFQAKYVSFQSLSEHSLESITILLASRFSALLADYTDYLKGFLWYCFRFLTQSWWRRLSTGCNTVTTISRTLAAFPADNQKKSKITIFSYLWSSLRWVCHRLQRSGQFNSISASPLTNASRRIICFEESRLLHPEIGQSFILVLHVQRKRNLEAQIYFCTVWYSGHNIHQPFLLFCCRMNECLSIISSAGKKTSCLSW